ncbi:hypothetical protein CYMTET_13452 [Cymbomonas tetramitiformis]|uniref:Uncharacterized protein n=1 Tax=Cymbomonas tetramitiformis TaxID=36881 RepID=A0AAE0LB59_9CHLO|nr:hypothetical protein CYMTET_13452 [Cymbomonas tetramitiformis]
MSSAEPRCRVGLVVYAVCRLPLGGGEGPARRQGGRELHLGAGSPQGYSHAAARRTCGCIMMQRNALAGGVAEGPAPAHVAARGCGGMACAMERDETRRHLQAAEARGALLGSALGGGAQRVRAIKMRGWGARLGGCEMRGMLGRGRDRYLRSNSLTGTVPTELGEPTRILQLRLNSNSLTGTVPTELGEPRMRCLAEPRCRGGLVVYAVCRLPLGGGEGPARRQGGRELHLGAGSPQGYSHAAARRTCGCIMMPLNALAGGVAEGPAPAHVAARGCGGTACAMERDETRRHLQAAEARGALLGSALGGGARRVRPSEMSGWGARLGGCEMRGMLGRGRDRHLYSNSLTGTVPTELGEPTWMHYLYLYSNSLTGTVPTELGELTWMSQLHLYSNSLTGTVPTELGEPTWMHYLAEPRCRVGLVVYAVCRLPLGGGEGPARRQGGRELHLGAGSPQGYSHAAARRTCGCIMMQRNALAGGVAEGPSPAHVAARGCGGTACAMERDETRRHLQAAEARGALLGSALGGGARRVRPSEMSGWGARLGGCEMRGMLGRGRDRDLSSNSLTGTVPTELGELTRMSQLAEPRCRVGLVVYAVSRLPLGGAPAHLAARGCGGTACAMERDETRRHLQAAEARGALLGSALGGGARRVRAIEMSGHLRSNSLTGTVPTELGELTTIYQLAEPRCRVGLVVYAVCRLPLGGGEGPARRQGGRELHLGAGSPQGYSHTAARRTCGCIMMQRNALAGGVAEGPSPAHVAARGCGGMACAMERDETRRHLQAAEARGALLGSALGGGARRVRAIKMRGYLYSNSLTGTVPTELGELTWMSQLAEPRCRVGLVVYAVCRLPLGGGEGPARRQGGRELHLGAGSPQGYSHTAARRTCGCIMMQRNSLAGGVADGPPAAQNSRARNRISFHLIHNNIGDRPRTDVCSLACALSYMPISGRSAEKHTYSRCRGCQYSTHISCLNKLFDEGMYAFLPGERTHTLCSECLISSPQLVVTWLRAMDQASGRRLDWLAILPTHRTVEGERYLNRVANVAKDFHYSKLAENPTCIAFADDYEGSAEEDEIEEPAAIATPPRILHPEAERKTALRAALLTTVRKPTRPSSSRTTSEAGDSQAPHDQAPSPLRSLPAHFASLAVQQSQEVPAAVGKYIPPHMQLSQPAARAANPLHPQLPHPPHPVESAAAGAHLPHPAAPIDPAGVFGHGIREVESQELRDLLVAEVTKAVRWPSAHQGNPGFDYLVSLPTPRPGISSYVTGAIDGVVATDPFSPSHVGWERYVNYSGNSIATHCKKQMMRIMFVNTLGERSKFEHTPLRQSMADLIQDGTSIRVMDNVQVPSYERFTTWCRKLIEEYTVIRDSGVGPYTHGHPHYYLLLCSAIVVITWLEFMLETVEYMRSEWPTLRFEAAYLLLTTQYISTRWAKQPYSETYREDRELLRLGAADSWGSARRDNVRQYVIDYFPHLALQRLLIRVNVTIPGELQQGYPVGAHSASGCWHLGRLDSFLHSYSTSWSSLLPLVWRRPSVPYGVL